MKKIIVFAMLAISLYGCDNKKGLEISSLDTYDTIDAKTELKNKEDKGTYYMYHSKDGLKSIDGIRLNQSSERLYFSFAKSGELCMVFSEAYVKDDKNKKAMVNLFRNTANILNNYAVPEHAGYMDNNNLTWFLNKKNGIKSISLSFSENGNYAYTVVDIITDNERYCNPEVMDQEKKGRWKTQDKLIQLSDSKTYTANLYSGNKGDEGSESLLMLRCQSNRLAIILGVQNYLGRSKKATVSFKLDDDVLVDQWGVESNGNYVYYEGDTKELFKQALKAKQLTITVDTHEGQVTSIFDLDRIDYATKDIVKACSINY